MAHEQKENSICDSTGCCCSVQADRGAMPAGHSNCRTERDGMGEVSPLTLATTFLLLGENWESESHPLCHPTSCPHSRREGKLSKGNYHPSPHHSPGLQCPSSLSGHRTCCSRQERRRRSAHTISAPLLVPGWSKGIIRHIPEPCCTPDLRWQRHTSLCCTTCGG